MSIIKNEIPIRRQDGNTEGTRVRQRNEVLPDLHNEIQWQGCSVVEMECSALADVCAFRGVTRGMILYTADSLADVDKYDKRNWGASACEYALTLCLDAVLKL